jgi:hypothetical protein
MGYVCVVIDLKNDVCSWREGRVQGLFIVLIPNDCLIDTCVCVCGLVAKVTGRDFTLALLIIYASALVTAQQ